MYLLKTFFQETNDDVSFEDIDIEAGADFIEERAAQREVSMEQFIDAIEASFEDFDHIETQLRDATSLSMEARKEIRETIRSYGEVLGMETQSVSLESLEDSDVFVAVSTEALTDFTGRFIQVFANLFKGISDDYGAVFTTNQRSLRKLKERIDKTQGIWDNKKKKLISRQVVSSYAGADIYLAFTTNNQMADDPIRAVQEDRKLSKLVLDDHQRKMAQYAGSYAKIIEGGEFDSNESFINSVLLEIGKLGNPVDVFDSRLLSDKPNLLGNCSWNLKKPKKVKVGEYEGELRPYIKAATQHRINLSYNVFENQKNLEDGQLFVDITYPLDKVDVLLKELADYCDHAIEFANNYKEIKDSHKRMLNAMKRIKKSSKYDVNKKLLKQLLSFSKYVSYQQVSPAKEELRRVKFIMSRASTYAMRVAKRTD